MSWELKQQYFTETKKQQTLKSSINIVPLKPHAPSEIKINVNSPAEKENIWTFDFDG